MALTALSTCTYATTRTRTTPQKPLLFATFRTTFDITARTPTGCRELVARTRGMIRVGRAIMRGHTRLRRNATSKTRVDIEDQHGRRTAAAPQLEVTLAINAAG